MKWTPVISLQLAFILPNATCHVQAMYTYVRPCTPGPIRKWYEYVSLSDWPCVISKQDLIYPWYTLRPRQNGRHFADIFKWIFLNKNVWIPIKISLKFVPQGPIDNIPALVQIMSWRRPGDKPLSGPMMVILPTHIYVTRPQWVNSLYLNGAHFHGYISISLQRLLTHWSRFDPFKQTSVKSYSKLKHFHSRKCIQKFRLENGGHLSRPQCVKTWIFKYTWYLIFQANRYLLRSNKDVLIGGYIFLQVIVTQGYF